jgi:hypothetical protein
MTASVPEGVASRMVYWWLLWWPSGRAVDACERCSDSSGTTRLSQTAGSPRGGEFSSPDGHRRIVRESSTVRPANAGRAMTSLLFSGAERLAVWAAAANAGRVLRTPMARLVNEARVATDDEVTLVVCETPCGEVCLGHGGIWHTVVVLALLHRA